MTQRREADGPGRAGRGRAASRTGQPPRERPAATANPLERAREICLRKLAVRPRTRAELAEALRRGGIEEDVAGEVLDRYDEVGMIDDAAFAKAWVSSRHHGKGLARRALAGELRRKGVDGESVDAALDELSPDTEESTARALAARRLRIERGRPPEVVFRRLVGALARKGYPAGLAIRVVKEAMAVDAEAAEFVDGVDIDALADAIEPER